MKQIILRNGLLGGLIVGLVLSAGTLYSYGTGKFEGSMVLGYASMLLAFSFIFVAVKQVRERLCNGSISFGKALKVALLVTLITSTVYVLVWLICYYFFVPDFMEQYSAYMMEKARASGMSARQLAAEADKMKMYSDMYKNPIMIILFTYVEILPVGILVSLVAAALLKKRVKTQVLQ